jgi:hypothetical protein
MLLEYEKAVFEYLRLAVPDLQRLIYAEGEDLEYIQGNLTLGAAYFSRKNEDQPLTKLVRIPCDIRPEDDQLRGDIRIVDYYLRTIDYSTTFIVEKEADAQRLANTLRFYFSDIPYVIAYFDLGEELEPIERQEFKLQFLGLRIETVRNHKDDKGAWRYVTVSWRSWIPMRRNPILTKPVYRGFAIAVNGKVFYIHPGGMPKDPEDVMKDYVITYNNRVCQRGLIGPELYNRSGYLIEKCSQSLPDVFLRDNGFFAQGATGFSEVLDSNSGSVPNIRFYCMCAGKKWVIGGGKMWQIGSLIERTSHAVILGPSLRKVLSMGTYLYFLGDFGIVRGNMYVPPTTTITTTTVEPTTTTAGPIGTTTTARPITTTTTTLSPIVFQTIYNSEQVQDMVCKGSSLYFTVPNSGVYIYDGVVTKIVGGRFTTIALTYNNDIYVTYNDDSLYDVAYRLTYDEAAPTTTARPSTTTTARPSTTTTARPSTTTVRPNTTTTTRPSTTTTARPSTTTVRPNTTTTTRP